MCEIDAVCAACHISKEQKRSYGQAQRAEYTNRTTGTRCDACRKWRQRKGSSINNVSLPNQVSISRQSALDVFRVLHIVGVVKVQDKNEERRLGVMQAALRLVDAAIAYNEGWVELRSSTAELQRRAFRLFQMLLYFLKLGIYNYWQVQPLISTHVRQDACLECDGGWGEISQGQKSAITKKMSQSTPAFKLLVKASQDLLKSCGHIHLLNHELFYLWNSNPSNAQSMLTGSYNGQFTHPFQLSVQRKPNLSVS